MKFYAAWENAKFSGYYFFTHKVTKLIFMRIKGCIFKPEG
jgi:hypothetical protein